ncbi:MAG: glycerol-3-phosphate 1-O-acyltransferase PlsY [Gemmatimonadota bacterium]|nr:glycerol-3-phosphate 1-O-acyltransferase PlsY [Gemmatimonadota bacterium]MDH3427281.1 glycerol-3-phosphate 1-O-acyltransferase PlsY [Gemmatimonadota bacterium]
MTAVGLLLFAYLMGSFPTSYLVGRIRGIDLREHGSGNLGATNTFRVLGAGAAIPVMIVDILKGFGPAALFAGWDGSGDARLALAYGGAAVAGHVWSVFLRFRGGKGVATGAGVLLALAPVTTIVALLVWIGVVALTRIVSAGSLAAATIVPPVAWLMDQPSHIIAFCVAVAAFVWWTHRANVRRLIDGTENRFGSGGQE